MAKKRPRRNAHSKPTEAPAALDVDVKWFVGFVAGCDAFQDGGLVAGFVVDDSRSHLHFSSSVGAFRKIASELRRLGY